MWLKGYVELCTDARDVESSESSSIRRPRSGEAGVTLHTHRYEQRGWGGEQLGDGHGEWKRGEVLPGKDSGRRCGAVGGTRWMNR